MGSVGPEGVMPTWFHNERANTVPDSKGDKKLRVDLFEMLNIQGVEKSTMDIANQFLIAAATDEVIEDSDDKKTAKLPGRVAVKISEEGGEDVRVYKYAFLNLNSLAKRLHVSTEEIKQKEKEGTLNSFIKTKVGELASQQRSITAILGEAIKGNPVFSPSRLSKVTPLLGEEDLILEEETTPPAEPSIPELADYLKNKRLLEEFIEKHFPDDTDLKEGLEDFLDDPTSEDSRDYAQNLVKKLWWDTGELGSELKVAPGKVALTNLSEDTQKVLKALNLSTFVGKAASRPGNAGSENTTRLSMVKGDKTGRYAIAIDDFLYAEKPEPRSRSEVALQLGPNMWVLANKNSLKRIGLTNAETSNESTINQTIKEKRKQINKFSQNVVRIANKLAQAESEGDRARISKGDMEFIRDLKNHPDEMIQEMTKEFLKTFDTWRKKQLKKITEDAFAEKAVGRVGKLIQDLEDAGLILHPRAEIKSFAERRQQMNLAVNVLRSGVEKLINVVMQEKSDMELIQEHVEMLNKQALQDVLNDERLFGETGERELLPFDFPQTFTTETKPEPEPQEKTFTTEPKPEPQEKTITTEAKPEPQEKTITTEAKPNALKLEPKRTKHGSKRSKSSDTGVEKKPFTGAGHEVLYDPKKIKRFFNDE
jgi:hypothetical protein